MNAILLTSYMMIQQTNHYPNDRFLQVHVGYTLQPLAACLFAADFLVNLKNK